MRILIIQLARLGDLYMSWPIVRAIRRQYPDAKIELLIRPLFKAATEGLTEIDVVHELPTQTILAPFFEDEPGALTESVDEVARFISSTRGTGFQAIYNMTFSELSSWITAELSLGADCAVRGYTRFADGSLMLPDEVSCYFYAQVGIEKFNRVHVTTLFAQLAQVELVDSDWALPLVNETRLNIPEKSICVHISASQEFKSMTPEMWLRMLSYICSNHQEYQIVLLGSFADRMTADAIMSGLPRHRVIDLVGKTRLVELFQVLRSTSMLIGGDSAPMHIASFTQTRCLNISIAPVNFWETGPLSDHSYILRFEDQSQIYPERVGQIALDLLDGKIAPTLAFRTGGVCSYAREESQADRFEWNLIEAIYMGGHFPVTESLQFVQAVEHLSQVNQVILGQLEITASGGRPLNQKILESSDDVIAQIYRVEPAVRPIIDWLRAERIKIGPGTRDEIVESMKKVHLELNSILRVYRIEDTDEVQDGAI